MRPVRRPGLGSRSERDAAFRLLVVSAQPQGVTSSERAASLLDRTSPEVLLTLAAYHGMSGLAYELLRTVDRCPEPLLAELRRRYTTGAEGHMRVMWQLAQVAGALAETGAGWAVLKGPVLVEELYDGRPGQRAYADLDLLVEPAAFGDAVQALEELGAEVLDRNWRMLRRDLRGELHYWLPGGTPLDLHWHVINMYRGRMQVHIPDLVGRSRRVDLGGVEVPTLDAEDGILHLALHAALGGGDRLLWLSDVRRAVATWRPAWETVEARARAWRIGAPVGLILDRSRQVLGADIPPDVARRLLGRRAAGVARWVDRLSPWQYGMGRVAAPSRLVARGIGHGLVGGLAWVAWRSVRNLDPHQARRASSFTPQGDEQDRAAYIAAVVAQGRRGARG